MGMVPAGGEGSAVAAGMPHCGRSPAETVAHLEALAAIGLDHEFGNERRG